MYYIILHALTFFKFDGPLLEINTCYGAVHYYRLEYYTPRCSNSFSIPVPALFHKKVEVLHVKCRNHEN